MRLTLLFLFCGCMMAGCSSKVLEPLYPTDGIQEFNYRQGLPNFFSKVKSRKEVTVAYLGGSITATRNGWRDITFNWLDSAYPGASFRQVDAAMGGTGSALGVFRIDRDVLQYNPDLIFIEFAVNDAGSAESIYKSMEGIVRKTWKTFPGADICFVYTLLESHLSALQGGNYQPSAAAMEKIAGHYGIPSIHMGMPVVQLLNEGKLVFTGNPADHPGKIVFTADGTHPLSVAGQNIYAQAVIRGLTKLSDFAMSKPHALKIPYIQDNWEEARMISLTDVTTTGSWELLPARDPLSTMFVKYLPEIYKAKTPGTSCTIRFSGKILGVYDLVGPASGILDVIVDGKPAIEVYRFDAYANYYRAHNYLLKELPEGDHEVTFVVTGKQFDKAAILAKRNIVITNPLDYEENTWFVGKLLLVGKLR
ncbi:MAG: SGNH/GDSL hydrolase family protein [Ferruginibacter sp.]|nr:SGNH/GDSL hydrolase family protein [Chitinophagaceae bacterium]